MMRALSVLALLTTCPILQAQPPQKKQVAPEELLPARSLIFFRYDGTEAHRAAYQKSALGRAMKDDLGEFVDHILGLVRDAFVQTALRTPRDEKEKEKDKDKEKPPPKGAAKILDAFLSHYWRHGIVVSADVLGANRAQLHVVFPEGGRDENRAAVLGFLKLAAEWDGEKLHSTESRGRTVYSRTWRAATSDVVPVPGVPPLPRRRQTSEQRAAWWVEHDHVVLTMGTEPFEPVLDLVSNQAPSVASSAWHKKLAGFQAYETDVRCYVNVQRVLELIFRAGESDDFRGTLFERPLRHLLMGRIGVRGLRDFSFHCGFSGKYQRSTFVLGIDPPAERSGILRFFSTPLALDFKKTSPAPADADFVEFHRIDFARVYDEFVDVSKALAAGRALQNRDLANLDFDFADLDKLIGINTRKDLFDGLDSTVVCWGDHTEGPFILGAAAAVKVKDERKLRRAMENLGVVLAQTLGERAKFEERMYRGVEMRVLRGGWYLAPTYAIRDGWLVVALNPQPVMSFIARAQGKRPAWKVPLEVEEVVAAMKTAAGPKSKLMTVWIDDPRRTMEIYLSLLPTLANAMSNAGFPWDENRPLVLDVTKVPPARSVTQYMFPHTTALFDDGDAFRLECYYSIATPAAGLALVLGAMFIGL